MAVYPEGSLNAELAKRYRDVLARSGIDLKLAPSEGAVESVARPKIRDNLRPDPRWHYHREGLARTTLSGDVILPTALGILPWFTCSKA
jgi:hypothetical protein